MPSIPIVVRHDYICINHKIITLVYVVLIDCGTPNQLRIQGEGGSEWGAVANPLHFSQGYIFHLSKDQRLHKAYIVIERTN